MNLSLIYVVISAVEKATNYLEKDELPPHWDKALFAGLDSQSADEESHDSDSDVCKLSLIIKLPFILFSLTVKKIN